MKAFISLDEEEQGDTPYYDLKQEILSLYGPRDEDAFKEALALRLTGKPSALGKKIIHKICPGSKPMEGCHCARIIRALWDAQLTTSIRSGLAGQSFTKDIFGFTKFYD